jgi:hypothetical protein
MPIIFRNAILPTILSLTVSACATTGQPAWIKSRATAPEFYRAKDQCLKDSQRHESYPDAGEVVITNLDRFSSCLNSEGWSLQGFARN